MKSLLIKEERLLIATAAVLSPGNHTTKEQIGLLLTVNNDFDTLLEYGSSYDVAPLQIPW